jgi:hypothetical protein
VRRVFFQRQAVIESKKISSIVIPTAAGATATVEGRDLLFAGGLRNGNTTMAPP